MFRLWFGQYRPKHEVKIQKGLSGLGLFAMDDIPKDDFIIEYKGPLLTKEQADDKGGLYLFAVTDTKWTIDGSSRANTARYLNHSCKPNCEAIADRNKIVIHAKRNIKAGEELTYDYGKEYMEDVNCKCGHC